MSRLTAKQLERAREDFDRYDTDRDKKVTVAEFTAVVENFLTPEDLTKLLSEVNPDNNGEISWEEFLADYEKDLDA